MGLAGASADRRVLPASGSAQPLRRAAWPGISPAIPATHREKFDEKYLIQLIDEIYIFFQNPDYDNRIIIRKIHRTFAK